MSGDYYTTKLVLIDGEAVCRERRRLAYLNACEGNCSFVVAVSGR